MNYVRSENTKSILWPNYLMLIQNSMKHNTGLKLHLSVNTNEDNVHKLLHYCESVGKMLNSMIDKASLFCQQK
jgi:hypothetical protein